jgi:flagellar basal body-associated protein FliL
MIMNKEEEEIMMMKRRKKKKIIMIIIVSLVSLSLSLLLLLCRNTENIYVQASSGIQTQAPILKQFNMDLKHCSQSL